MHLRTDDYVKKALLDTQERIRDYMEYAQRVKDPALSDCFREFAKTEAEHAQRLQGFLAGLE